MKVNSRAVAVMIFVILFGGIGAAKGLGVWRTESTKIPAKFTSGEFAGQYNPEDIRGSFTFGDVSNSFAIPVEELAKAFGIQVTDPTALQVKDLGTVYAASEAQGKPVETASMRMFVAYYKGLPFTVTEETYLPKPAVEILKSRGKLTPEQEQYIASHTVDVAKPSDAQNVEPSTSKGAEGTKSGEGSESLTDGIIKGTTTFKEVLDWGVSKFDIERIIGGKIPSTGMTIRDYCVQQGLEFSTVKTQLQDKANALK